MKAKKTNNGKEPHEAHFPFPCGDFQKMAEMMKNCCPREGGAIDCFYMMKRMMERGKWKEPKKPQETQNPPKGRENG